MLNLKKELDSTDEVRKELETVLASGGMMVEALTEPKTREPALIEVYVGKKKETELSAEVVYAAPMKDKFQVGVELKGEWQKRVETLLSKLEATDKKWGKDSESLFHAISKMETHEKIALAVKGNREERRLLMKDTHYMIHPYILKNPKLTSDEVAQISRMGTLTQEMIKSITDNAEWMSNSSVRLSMIKNPKTPANLVQKFMPQLKDNDLMQLAKSESVRENVSNTARRILASRGKIIR